jgi:hypothetical protein
MCASDGICELYKPMQHCNSRFVSKDRDADRVSMTPRQEGSNKQISLAQGPSSSDIKPKF